MAAVSVGALLLSTFGVYLIYLTFKQTRRAAVYAGVGARHSRRALAHMKEASEADLRPWLAVSLDLSGPAQFIESGLHFDAYVVVKNVGKSPAKDVIIKLDVFDQLAPKQPDTPSFVEACREVAETTPGGFIIAPNEETRNYRGFKLLRVKFPTGRRPYVLPLIMVSVTYRKLGGQEALQTSKGFIIERLNMLKKNIGGSFEVDTENEVPLDRLRIRHAAEGTAT